MNDPGVIDSHGDLEMLVDHVLPLLPPYEFNVYLVLLRLTHAGGTGELRIGNRTISARLGRVTRSTGGNYRQITDKLKALQALGFIRIGDVNRQGTAYTVYRPEDVPAVRERLDAAASTVASPRNFYRDPDLRRELFDRDGWRCRYCGVAVTDVDATLDHIVPQHLDGSDEAPNLATACLLCNSIKSGHTYEEAAPLILQRVAERTRPSG